MKKSFGEVWSSLTTEQREYLRGYINRQREDAVELYKANQEKLQSVTNKL